MKTKVCSRCDKTKPLAEFYVWLNKKTGKTKVRGPCNDCQRSYMAKYATGYRERRKEHLSERSKARNQERRMQCLVAYGGDPPACACCGEATREFLALDHKDGNGRRHRAEVGHGTQLYYWMIRHKFPPLFQVLCHNCNAAKQFYGGCPHQAARPS